MSAIELKIDHDSGELLPNSIMVPADKAPAILIDISDVKTYHTEPEKILEKIRIQAGYPVFDIGKKAGRDACRTHAANIIKTIAPAINASKALAAEAKKIINQDLAFRRDFESGIREIAAFHRAPLTEYEEKQARIEEEKRLAYLKLEEARIAAEKKAEEDLVAFELAVSQRVDQEQKRLAIDAMAKPIAQLIISKQEYIDDAYKNRHKDVNFTQNILLTRTVLIDAVAAHLGISTNAAAKALYEVFLI